MSRKERPGPRERLLRAAIELTYAQGVAVGVDAILAHADVARRSLYEHFGGKDGLIAAALRRAGQRDLERYRAALAAGGSDARQRLLSLFGALEPLTSQPGFRGCRFINADLALPAPDHPAHQVVAEHKHAVRALLQAELTAAAHPEPEHGATQLLLLLDGVLVTGALRPDSHPSKLAQPLVRAILEGRLPR